MPKERIIGIYPGTFDPITLGHLDIIKRACVLVDHLIIGVAVNPYKNPFFSAEERVALVKDDIETLLIRKNLIPCSVEVKSFDNFMLDFAHQAKARIIIRGLRAISDFEYEFRMAGLNFRKDPRIETVFLMTSERFQFISSSVVKEISRLGGNLEDFVSPSVAESLEKKL